MIEQLAGVLPAVVTPLNQDESFAPGAMEVLLERLYAGGAHGVYLCGQTGEGLLQPREQREKVAEVGVRCSPKGKAAVVHVGAGRTADAVALARHAGRIGASAVSSLPPAGSYSFREIRRYYEAIAQASGLPVLVYFFPEVSAAISSLDQILDLCSIPNVVGLKFTDFDLYKMSLISGAGHHIYNGRDEIFAAGMLMGAHGGIGTFYNLIPESFVRVYELARCGEWAQARALQDRINELIRITLRFPMLPAVKKMLEWSGVQAGPCVTPRRALAPAEETELRELLTGAGFDPAGFLENARR